MSKPTSYRLIPLNKSSTRTSPPTQSLVSRTASSVLVVAAHPHNTRRPGATGIDTRCQAAARPTLGCRRQQTR